MMQVWGAGTESQEMDPNALLDRMTDGFFAIDGEWRIVYLNQAAYDRLFRVPDDRDSKPALQGTTLWEALPEEAESRLMRAFQEAMLSQRASRVDYRNETNERLELRLYPSAAGMSILVLPAAEDPLQLQRRLEASEARLQSLTMLSREVIAHISPEGIVQDVSAAVERMLGYRPDEVIGMPASAFCMLDELQDARNITRDEVWPHDRGVVRLRFRHRSGEYVTCEVAYARIRRLDGTLLHTVGVCRDISERVAAQEALRQTEDHFLLTQRIAGIGNYEWNLLTGEVKWSDEMHEIMGWERGSDPDVRDTFRRIIHPEDLEPMAAYVQHAQERALAGSDEMLTVEFRVIAKSGEVRSIRSVGRFFYDKQGCAERFFGTVRDITGQKQTEEMLQKSEKLKMVGQLAAGIAHEIRNPLTSLKGFSKLLRHATDAQAERYYNIMEAEFDRIEMILGELLVLAKPHATSYQPWDVRLIVQEVADLLGSQAILSNVIIHTEIAARDGIVQCEKNQLKQVIMNIVKNAIEAMPSGGDLRVRVNRDASHLLISVSDQGVGIAEDKLPKLGEPFYTTKEKGTGLGLMVSYKIIEEHAGSLEFASQPNAGTTVTIRLPIHR